MAAALEPVTFTTRGEMASLLSSLGVDARISESPDGLVSYYASYGTSEVYFFVSKAGPVAVLAACPWVRHKATLAAALFLTGHGGEPLNETLSGLWEAAQAQLQMILDQKASVPGLLDPAPTGQAPFAFNVRVDMQRIPTLRRVANGATDHPRTYRPPPDYPTQGWPIG